jgi:hypothetical protein
VGRLPALRGGDAAHAAAEPGLGQFGLGGGVELQAVAERQVLNLDLPQLGTDKVRKAIDEIAAKKAAIDAAAPGTRGRDYNIAREKITKGTYDRDR